MNNPVLIGNATLYNADCIEVLKALPENSIEACLTDPPYGLSQHSEADIRACMAAWLAGKPYVHGGAGFMGKIWDSFVPGPEMWKELYRVLKPGAHLLVFAGTRTADLMSMALRLAGFECRETLLFCFGSGFPKSANVSKMIDSMKGAEREVVGIRQYAGGHIQRSSSDCLAPPIGTFVRSQDNRNETALATPEAAQWDGWFSSLKPSYEPILLFRKPLDGTIAGNTLKWGCGGLNIKACRVGSEATLRTNGKTAIWGIKNANNEQGGSESGRYPSTIILDSSEQVEKCFPVTASGKPCGVKKAQNNIYGQYGTGIEITGFGDTGSASRFFQHCDYTLEEIAELNGIEPKRIVYSGKASKRDRDEGCEMLEEREAKNRHAFSGLPDLRMDHAQNRNPTHNHHPSVKPCNLLRYCLKLICPPGSTVIDPFLGSGSTAKAALLEGFNVIGIEREPDYFEIACARTAHVAPEAFDVKAKPTKTAPVQAGLFEYTP